MKIATAILLSALLALPARADEVEASIDAALQAWRAGDIRTAKENLDLASQMLGRMKAEALRGFLPAPLDGWERTEAEPDMQAMAAFGGGQMAGARYTDGERTLEIMLTADNRMVAAMGAMFASAALMGAMGEVRQIAGEAAIVSPEGDMQALIDGRVMVQITGPAGADAKAAYFEALDIAGLKAF